MNRNRHDEYKRSGLDLEGAGAHCPTCTSFSEECNVDPTDYDKPCRYYEPVRR